MRKQWNLSFNFTITHQAVDTDVVVYAKVHAGTTPAMGDDPDEASLVSVDAHGCDILEQLSVRNSEILQEEALSRAEEADFIALMAIPVHNRLPL